MKFKTIILLEVCIIMSVFMGIFMFCSSREYRKAIQTEKYSITNFYINNVLKDIDNLFLNIENLSYLPFSKNDLIERCKNYHMATSNEQAISNAIFSETVSEMLLLQNELHSAVLYDAEYQHVFSIYRYDYGYHNFLESQLLYNQDLISSILTPLNEKKYGTINYGFFSLDISPGNTQTFIYAARQLRTFRPYENAGYIVMLVPTFQLASIFTNDNDISHILLLDDANQIVYEPSGQWVGCSADQYIPGISDIFSQTQTGYRKFYRDNSPILVSGRQSLYSGWKIITIQNAKDVYYTANKVTWMLVFLFMLTLLATLVFITIFISHITKPLAIMSTQLQNMDLDNPGEEISNAVRGREFVILTNAYNTMLQKIKDMLENEYKSVIREKEFQLSLLQLQIQPHFLYNTLDTIRMSAILNHDLQTADMILELSDFFRKSITNERIVLLEDEFSQIASYLSLLKMRYAGLKPQLSLDERLRYIEIPSFILQPLAENAFIHGLKPHGCAGSISITAEIISDNAFAIVVEDDGDGVSDETIALLNEKFSRLSSEKIDTDSFTRIGLFNVSWRLYNFFGSRAHICVGMPENGGFFIKITVTEESPCFSSCS